MTRKTLGLTRKRNKDAKPVAEEAEDMVGVEGEADPQKNSMHKISLSRFLNLSRFS